MRACSRARHRYTANPADAAPKGARGAVRFLRRHWYTELLGGNPNAAVTRWKTAPVSMVVTERFDTAAVKDTIREAQQMVPGYSYKKFCAKVMAAGCAGYLVSLLGMRVVYYGRTGEIHTAHFPGTKQ